MFRPAKSVDNELAEKVGQLIRTDDDFTKQCILQYLKLSDESKDMFKQFLISIVEGYKEEENKKAAPEEPPND